MRGEVPAPEAEKRIKELELDRVAWNLPSPPPEEVRLPPETVWPPWPFAVVKEEDPLEPG
jgi:hypothetical protein